MSKELNYKECLALLEEFNTPSHVIKHCEAVANVALKVGLLLNEKGFNLDCQLAFCSGMLHDMARAYPNHDKVAADYLEKKGYAKEANIIRVHMHYPSFNSAKETTETDLVCLGDRVCKEDKYVGLEERMEYILSKAKENKEAQKIILEKKEDVAKYILNLEEIMGITLNDLMKG